MARTLLYKTAPKIRKDYGGKCSPISSQMAWCCTISSLLTHEAGLLPGKDSRQPRGKCVSLLQLQEVRMPQLLSYATPHLLQVPWALHSAQHVGGNTPSPPLSQVAPPHPLPGSNGQAGRCAPPYVMGAGGLPCNLGLAASTTRQMTGSWGRRGMRFPFLSSENPASSQD